MAGIIYKNPPLREAIFDVRFKFENLPDQGMFEEAYEQIKVDYPKREVTSIQSVLFEVKQGEEPKLNTTTGANGLRLTSSDTTRIAQFRMDGFSFSQLKPYSGWEDFIAEGERLLSIYVQMVKPQYAERIALRYINGIKIPEKTFKIDDYFLTAPKIGEEVPQGLVNFFSRLVIKDDASESYAIVNQTVEESGEGDTTTVLFDIDAFQTDLRIEPLSDAFRDILTAIKNYRTKIFQGSITEKTKQLFS